MRRKRTQRSEKLLDRIRSLHTHYRSSPYDAVHLRTSQPLLKTDLHFIFPRPLKTLYEFLPSEIRATYLSYHIPQALYPESGRWPAGYDLNSTQCRSNSQNYSLFRLSTQISPSQLVYLVTFFFFGKSSVIYVMFGFKELSATVSNRHWSGQLSVNEIFQIKFAS